MKSSSPRRPAAVRRLTALLAATAAASVLTGCGLFGDSDSGSAAAYQQLPLSDDLPANPAGRQLRWFLDAAEELPIEEAELEEHLSASLLAELPARQLNATLGNAIGEDGVRLLGITKSSPTEIEAAIEPAEDRRRQRLVMDVDDDGKVLGLQLLPYPLRSRVERGLDRVSLSRPGGSHEVGTEALVVEDAARAGRRVPVQLWYPATSGGRDPRPTYAAPATTDELAHLLAVPEEDVAAIDTHARAEPEVAGGERFPVVLFSPGYALTRPLYSGYAVDLASRGYVVAVLDHPGDGALVEYPDGTTVKGEADVDVMADPLAWLEPRVADIRSVLDDLGRLDAEAGGRFEGALDLEHVAAIGHSLGGAASAEAMLVDSRIDAGANFDGTFFGAVATAGLDRPFLLMSTELVDNTWEKFRSGTDVAPWVVLADSSHLSFSDWPSLAGLRPGEEVEDGVFDIGTLRPERSVEVQHAYVVAFLDQHLRGGPGRLLAGPSDDYPEVTFR